MPPFPPKQQDPRIWTIAPWKWLFSLHVGVTLLAALAIASLAGTLIPDSSPGAGDALHRAQHFVYYTWWYRLLLLLLTVNVSCTTVRTLIEKILPSLRPRFIRAANFYANKPSRSFRFEGAAPDAAAALAKRGFRAATDGVFGYASKGDWNRFGAPVAHTGIVIVLLSGFAAGWVSREGTVSLFEGGTAVAMNSEDPRAENFLNAGEPLGFTLQCDDFEVGFFPKTDPPIPSKYITTVTSLDSVPPVPAQPVEVNRSVKINGWILHQTGYREIPGLKRFLLNVSETDAASSFSLELSPGQTRLLPGRGEIRIALGESHPYPWAIRNAGETLAQGTLFPDLEPTDYRFHIRAKRSSDGRALGEFELGLGGEIPIGENVSGESELRLKVERFEPDFSMGPGGSIASRSRELNNPAVRAALSRGGESVLSAWLFSRPDLKEMMSGMMHNRTSGYELDFVRVSQVERKPETEPRRGPWEVESAGSVPAYRTELTLTRNPAVPFIYAGCAVMMAGLLLVFTGRRKEIWFRVNAAGKELQVAGRYRYPRETLDNETLRALEELCGLGTRLPDKKAE